MKLGVGGQLTDSSKDFFGCPRDQQVRAFSQYSFGDLSDLLGRLALAKNHLGEPQAQFAMMIDSRNFDVFERQASEPARCFINIDTPGSHFFKQLLEPVSIHLDDCSTASCAGGSERCRYRER